MNTDEPTTAEVCITAFGSVAILVILALCAKYAMDGREVLSFTLLFIGAPCVFLITGISAAIAADATRSCDANKNAVKVPLDPEEDELRRFKLRFLSDCVQRRCEL